MGAGLFARLLVQLGLLFISEDITLLDWMLDRPYACGEKRCRLSLLTCGCACVLGEQHYQNKPWLLFDMPLVVVGFMFMVLLACRFSIVYNGGHQISSVCAKSYCAQVTWPTNQLRLSIACRPSGLPILAVTGGAQHLVDRPQVPAPAARCLRQSVVECH